MARREPRRGRLPWGFGVAVALVVHGLLGWLFATASPAPRAAGSTPGASGRPMLCDGMRCPMLPARARRREADRIDSETVLQAMIIPKLGLAKRNPRKLPKIQKYEQPKKAEVSINVRRKNAKPTVVPKAPKKKRAELDRRRPKKHRRPSSLAAVLGAPEDDDPRARAATLRRIVGVAEGSVRGHGSDFQEGDPYAGKVQLAIRRQFRAPQAIPDPELRKLRVEVHVRTLRADGTIRAYRVVRRSGNRLFDAAAIAAIKSFVPAEGGRARLPAPDAAAQARLRGRGLLVILDGREL